MDEGRKAFEKDMEATFKRWERYGPIREVGEFAPAIVLVAAFSLVVWGLQLYSEELQEGVVGEGAPVIETDSGVESNPNTISPHPEALEPF